MSWILIWFAASLAIGLSVGLVFYIGEARSARSATRGRVATPHRAR